MGETRRWRYHAATRWALRGRRDEAGHVCRETIEQPVKLPAKIISDIRPSDRSLLDVADVRSSLRSLMWRRVGIERSGEHLSTASEKLDFWASYTLDKIFDDQTGWEVQNLLLNAALIAQSAGWRTESRGTHARTDKPKTDPAMRVHDLWTCGHAEPSTVPIRDAVPAPD